MSRRHAWLERSVAELRAHEQRVAGALEHKRQQQALARAQLPDVLRLVADLEHVEAQIARRLRQTAAALAARAEPQATEPALAVSGAGTGSGGAMIARRALRPERALAGAAPSALAEVRAVAQIAGGIPGLPHPGGRITASATARTSAPLLPVADAPHRLWPGGAWNAAAATALEVAFRPDTGLSAFPDARARRSGAPVPAAAIGAAGRPAGGRAALRSADRGRARWRSGVDDRFEVAFAAAPGQAVAAPVAGEVVFAGAFRSYGLLLIIEHEHEYHTLLWGFARLDVETGAAVRVGQLVGIMGTQSPGPPVLHVERRRYGRPINLAASSSGIRG
jgi:murein DD-endopeptidase MepM/ murein hydrolase activator NlpD